MIYNGMNGIWTSWDYGEGNQMIVLKQSENLEALVREVYQNSGGHITFWPFGTSLDDANNWWCTDEPRMDGVEIIEPYVPPKFGLTTININKGEPPAYPPFADPQEPGRYEP